MFREKITVEHIFLSSVVLITVWMLITTFDFSWETAFYPRWMAILLLFCIAVLLVKRRLPENIQKRFEDESSSTYGEIDTSSSDERESSIIAVQFGVFIISSYIFGFLFSSLWYTYAVQHYFGFRNIRMRLFSTGLIGAFVYLGYLVLGVDLSFGVFFNWVGW